MTTQNISLSIPTMNELIVVYQEINSRLSNLEREVNPLMGNKYDELEALDKNELRNRIREIDPIAYFVKETAQKVIDYANEHLPKFEKVPLNQISLTERHEWRQLFSFAEENVSKAKNIIIKTDLLVILLTEKAGIDATELIKTYHEKHFSNEELPI